MASQVGETHHIQTFCSGMDIISTTEPSSALISFGAVSVAGLLTLVRFETQPTESRALTYAPIFIVLLFPLACMLPRSLRSLVRRRGIGRHDFLLGVVWALLQACSILSLVLLWILLEISPKILTLQLVFTPFNVAVAVRAICVVQARVHEGREGRALKHAMQAALCLSSLILIAMKVDIPDIGSWMHFLLPVWLFVCCQGISALERIYLLLSLVSSPSEQLRFRLELWKMLLNVTSFVLVTFSAWHLCAMLDWKDPSVTTGAIIAPVVFLSCILCTIGPEVCRLQQE